MRTHHQATHRTHFSTSVARRVRIETLIQERFLVERPRGAGAAWHLFRGCRINAVLYYKDRPIFVVGACRVRDVLGPTSAISRVGRHQSLDFRILLACGNFSALARPRPHCCSSFKASPFIIISCKQGLYPYIKSTTARVDPCRQYDATSGTSSP